LFIQGIAMSTLLVSVIAGNLTTLVLMYFAIAGWKYWVGYKDGFSEGLNSSRSLTTEYLKKLNDDKTIQNIIDSNLDKNPGFIAHMNLVKELLEASRETWNIHGKPGDALDKAIRNFAKIR
jgi:hypothetical protein